MLSLDVILEVTHGVLFPLIGEVAELDKDDFVKDEFMRGSVTIEGVSHAIVTVDCSELLARRLGGAMFDVEASSLSDEEVADALGEIANIIGGNIKALLPGPSQLGLPEINYQVRERPSLIAVEQSFHCAGEPFRVCLAATQVNSPSAYD
jgi:chemotaxis protein CheX